MIGVFKRALESKETIQIMYMDAKEEVSHRYVRMIALNDTHAICYCHYKKQRRIFRLDNILAASPTPNKRKSG